MPIALLDRTVISLKGDDVEVFLGGLVTNNLKNPMTFSALLTPQGKIIADFFVHKTEGSLVLETPAKFGKALLLRLKMYKLRAKIDIEDISTTHHIYALWNGHGDIGKPDPRHDKLGQRLLTQDLLACEHTPEDYDRHRLSLGIPDSQWDFGSEQRFPADANMDLLSGVDYKKGCFIGQEVVSRMHRKTSVRKRMCAVKLSSAAKAGDELTAGPLKIGILDHVRGDHAMALIRLDRLAKASETVCIGADKPVTIMEPNYEPQS